MSPFREEMMPDEARHRMAALGDSVGRSQLLWGIVLLDVLIALTLIRIIQEMLKSTAETRRLDVILPEGFDPAKADAILVEHEAEGDGS